MSRHRAVRPRYGRIAMLGSAMAVTAVAMLGGTGVLPSLADDEPAPDASIAEAAAPATPLTDAAPDNSTVASEAPATEVEVVDPSKDPTLPAASGQGYRVVFSEARQRVWLVGDGDAVARTYRVSGSVYDNLDPGTYSVYSRSEQAYGIDDSGTMKYFVRFTQGENAAIGFHDIPEKDGRLVQSFQDLGTPQSHGCIRQKRKDAIALWDFAPLGTTVVVTA